MDVDSIDLGRDFIKTIEETARSCDLLIAMIVEGWLTSLDEAPDANVRENAAEPYEKVVRQAKIPAETVDRKPPWNGNKCFPI